MKKQKFICATCGKVFYKIPTDRRCKTTYCSRACYMPALAARNREQNSRGQTPEAKEKLRNAHLIEPDLRKTYTKIHGRHTHRIVAEQMLGRPLKEGEVVHHIDGNKQNNSPENLMVFASQSDHAKWHIEHKKEVMPK